MLTSNFDAAKAALLRDIAAGNDLSPKGCIDAPILDLVQCINGLSDFCTTSSCSGRISCYINAGLSKGIQWLLVRHGVVDVHSVLSSLGPINPKAAIGEPDFRDGQLQPIQSVEDAPEELTVLKCEGALMHILCRDVASARRLHAIAMTCGFRESGISLSPKKVMLAIRSTAFSLEFPIASRGELIIGLRALTVGVREANRRILANFARSDRLLAAIKDEFQWPVFKEIPLLSNGASMEGQSPHMLSRWGHAAARCGEPSQRLIAVAGGFGYVDATSARADRKLPVSALSIGHSAASIAESYGQISQLSSLDSSSAPEWNALKCMHAAISSDSRFIVVHGGRNSPMEAIGTTTIFDRHSFQMMGQIDCNVAGAPGPRWGHTLTCVGGSAFLLVGGRTPSGLATDAFMLQYKEASDGDGAFNLDAWSWSRVVVNCDAKAGNDSMGNEALTRVFHSACALNPDLSGFRHRLFPGKDTNADKGDSKDLERQQQNADGDSESVSDSDRYSQVLFHGGIINMETSETDRKFYLVEVRRSLTITDCFEAVVKQLSSADDVFPTRFGHVLMNIGCKCVAVIGGATFASDDDCSFGDSCNHSITYNEETNKCAPSANDKCGVATQQLLVFDWSFDDAGEVHLKLRRSVVHVASSDFLSASDAPKTLPYICSIEAECRVHHQCVSFRDALGFNNDLVLLGGGVLCVGFSAHFCSAVMLRVSHGGALAMDARDPDLAIDQDDKVIADANAPGNAYGSHDQTKVRLGLTILAPKKSVKTVKSVLEEHHMLDKSRRISSFAHDGATIEQLVVTPSSDVVVLDAALSAAEPLMAIPVLGAFAAQSRGDMPSTAALKVTEELSSSWPASKGVIFMATQKTLGSKLDIVSSQRKAFDFLANVCSQYRLDKADLPRKFEIVGDVLMISEGALPESKGWSDSNVPHLWRDLAMCFDLARVARHARIDSGPKRESRVQLLLPSQRDADVGLLSARLPDRPGWVVVNENGIRFGFDILKVMFCSGNVTERMRMSRVQAKGEVVVDLYCGVGYYTLPFLVYAGVKYLHAFEWNPNSVASLLVNLAAAKISPDRCMVHYGNNVESVFGVRDGDVRAATLKQSPPLFDMSSLVGSSKYTVRSSAAEPPGDWSDRLHSIADRVCLGLLPSSRGGWEAACHVLKASGGTLHVHYNVIESEIPKWVEECAATFSDLFIAAGKPMHVVVAHVERVKSYAPKVLHIVVDLVCSPRADTGPEGHAP
jgi:tRNA G37 N-methylase Trm5/tRNA(Phe) wybutosine-synthesizing methylase Tyw3